MRGVLLKRLIDNSANVFPNTWDQAKFIAPDVVIEKADFYDSSKSILITASVPASTAGHQYQMLLRLSPVANPDTVISSKTTLAKAKCSCSAFIYWVQYPLYSNGALEGTPSSVAKIPANVRNPGNTPALCKHLLALCQALNQVGKLEI
jgi:hypothetical protein